MSGTVIADPAVGSATTVEIGAGGLLGGATGGGGSTVVPVDGSPVVVGEPPVEATCVVTADSTVVEVAFVASVEVGASIVAGGAIVVLVVVVAAVVWVVAAAVVGAAVSVVTASVLVSAWANAIIDGPSPTGTTARQASARTATRLVRTPARFVAMDTSVERCRHPDVNSSGHRRSTPLTVDGRITPFHYGGAVTSPGQDLSSLLPGYAFERELGRGAMGVVFLARHESLGRSVAVKELQGALAADPATRSRFVVEAKVMASLDHPHVVPVYDFVERDDRCVLVMEQLPGGTVWDQFVSDGMTMPRAMAITLATCSAMQHAHEQGVLHRDIKPENLMFDGAGSMKVTDFGIARVVNGASTRATAAGSVLGTPAYMAPEQAEGGDIGPAVDVYAAATMLYEMLSGRLPFEQTDSLTAMLTQRILHDPTPLRTVAPHVPDAIAVATMRGLDRSPTTRTASAEQLGVDLARAAAATWGPSWLDAAGLTVAGSEAIETAARTAGAVGSAGGARATVLPGTVPAPTDRITSDTVVGASAPSTADDDAPTGPSTEPATEPPTDTPGHSAEPTASSIDPVTVKPKASDRDVGRAKADEIDQLIDISEILESPPRPVAQYLIAAALFVAGLAWAVIGGGTTDTPNPPSPIDAAGITVNGVATTAADEPIEIDLNEPIEVEGLDGRTVTGIEFEQFGLPIGDAPSESVTSDLPGCCASLDPGYIGRITSGAVEATLVLEDPITGSPTPVATFDVTGTNPWYLTAAGIISVILVLFGAASIESYLRAFRRGRGGVATFGGLVVGGAIFGAAAAVAGTIIFGTARGPIAIAGPAALCACGALALGLATRANRTRRRAARQELRHTAIKALASSRR